MREVLSELPSDVTKQNMYLNTYNNFTFYETEQCWSNYQQLLYRGLVKEITYPRVPLANLDLKLSLAIRTVKFYVQIGLGNPRLRNFP